jgi:hypothetical protein
MLEGLPEIIQGIQDFIGWESATADPPKIWACTPKWRKLSSAGAADLPLPSVPPTLNLWQSQEKFVS